MRMILALLPLLASMAVSAKDFLDMTPEERDALPVVKSDTFDYPEEPDVKAPDTLKQAKAKCQQKVKKRREVYRVGRRLRKFLVEEAYVHFQTPEGAPDSKLRKKHIDRGHRCFNMYPGMCDSPYLEACLGATILDILAVGARPTNPNTESTRDSHRQGEKTSARPNADRPATTRP